MVNSWFITVIVVVAICVIGLGIGLFIYSKVKPKRQTWQCVVYSLSRSRIESLKDANGNLIKLDRPLSRLVPLGIDLIIYDGQDYRLKDTNLTIPYIDADSIVDFRSVVPKKKASDYDRFVEVLVDEGSATIIKSGYDKDTGLKIWEPMPYDRASANMADYRAKSSRWEEAMSNWIKALPWVLGILALLAVIVIGVSLSQAYVKVGDKYANALDRLSIVLDKQNGVIPLPPDPIQNNTRDEVFSRGK